MNHNSPDLLLLLEYTPEWKQNCADLYTNYPYFIEEVQKDFGIALFSKLPLHDSNIRFDETHECPVIEAKIQVEKQTVLFFGMHPKPPVPWMDHATEDKDDQTIRVAKAIKNSEYPVIIAGDFNDVKWSTLMKAFVEEANVLDPRIGRGLLNTFHSEKWYINYPIDHIFMTRHFGINTFKKTKLQGSDHFGLYSQFSFVTT